MGEHAVGSPPCSQAGMKQIFGPDEVWREGKRARAVCLTAHPLGLRPHRFKPANTCGNATVDHCFQITVENTQPAIL